MADTFTEITGESWIGRLGKSIGGIVFGFVLVLVSIIGLFWNEGRAVHTAQALSEGAKNCITVSDPTKVSPADEGKLVCITGLATTSETLSDPTFGVSATANALRLTRQAPMYQWVEDKNEETHNKVGGGTETVTTYTYSTQWKDAAVNSSAFHSHDARYQNPPKIYEGQTFSASKVTVGAFQPSHELTDKITTNETLDTSSAKLPDALAAKFKPMPGGGFYMGADASSPQVGDQKITFRVVKPTTVTLAATQTGSSLTPYVASNGTTISLLKEGTLTADQLFATAQQENKNLTWIIRGVGVLLMWFGLLMILSPIRILADVVPFIGELVGGGIALLSIVIAAVISLVDVAIAWIVYRPLLGIGLLVVAGLLIYWHRTARKKRAALVAPAQA